MLVRAEEFGGNQNHFIVCRKVDGVPLALTPELKPIKLEPSDQPSTSGYAGTAPKPSTSNNQTRPSNPLTPLSAKKLTPVTPDAPKEDFYQDGFNKLSRLQYPATPTTIKQLRVKALVLFTIITPKGKRVDLDNNGLLELQKKADGKGKAIIPYDGENVELNVIEIMKAVKSGQKVMLIKDPNEVPKPFDAKSSEAMKKIQEQLDNAVARNAKLFKKKKK